MTTNTVVFIGLLCFTVSALGDKPCIPRKFNHSSVVCVCNATYCDEISKIVPLNPGHYVLYTTTQSGKRFERTTGDIINDDTHSEQNYYDTFNNYYGNNNDEIQLRINRSKTYQSIFGFGGAFTDSSGINILSLSEKTQENIMKSYFSDDGLEYNMGRVPIGGCDFSTHGYAYNMKPEHDINLSNYSLTSEDFNYKIPFIKKAMGMINDEMLLIASAWSPPPWMKTNNDFRGSSRLVHRYYQTWAKYHLKFLENYHDNGVPIWALTTGNEPIDGLVPIEFINTLGWTPIRQAHWISENLGPTIRDSKFSKVHILALDDQRIVLPWWIHLMSKVNGTMSYVDGIALHWYWDDWIPVSVVNSIKSSYPNLYIVSSEACTGDRPWEFEKVELGSWRRAERYLHDIIENTNNWYSAWIDWNLVLDTQGGPNWVRNYVDSPIIAIPENDEFYKQPMFYSIGHISKFVPRKSKRIFLKIYSNKIECVAFLRPDNGITIVCLNPTNENRNVIIKEEGIGKIRLNLEAYSFNTVVYW